MVLTENFEKAFSDFLDRREYDQTDIFILKGLVFYGKDCISCRLAGSWW